MSVSLSHFSAAIPHFHALRQLLPSPCRAQWVPCPAAPAPAAAPTPTLLPEADALTNLSALLPEVLAMALYCVQTPYCTELDALTQVGARGRSEGAQDIAGGGSATNVTKTLQILVIWAEWLEICIRGEMVVHWQPPVHGGAGGGLKELVYFFVKDRPKGPSIANHQPPPTASRHQPPTANRRQPLAGPTANRQPLPTAINHQSPATNRRQPSPTASNRQSPTAHRPPPTANAWCARGLFWENCVTEQFFFSQLRTALQRSGGGGVGQPTTHT